MKKGKLKQTIFKNHYRSQKLQTFGNQEIYDSLWKSLLTGALLVNISFFTGTVPLKKTKNEPTNELTNEVLSSNNALIWLGTGL